MADMDPFREFDDPRPEIECIALGDGSFLISMEGLPPVPWRTGFASYEATQREVQDCYPVYWEVDMRTGLERLADIIRQFKAEHSAELQEAVLAHELDSDSRKWPVLQEVEVMEDLYTRWAVRVKGSS